MCVCVCVCACDCVSLELCVCVVVGACVCVSVSVCVCVCYFLVQRPRRSSDECKHAFICDFEILVVVVDVRPCVVVAVFAPHHIRPRMPGSNIYPRVQRLPVFTAATTFAPSALEATVHQFLVSPVVAPLWHGRSSTPHTLPVAGPEQQFTPLLQLAAPQ